MAQRPKSRNPKPPAETSRSRPKDGAKPARKSKPAPDPSNGAAAAEHPAAPSRKKRPQQQETKQDPALQAKDVRNRLGLPEFNAVREMVRQTPGWLSSVIVHVIVLMALAMFTLQSERELQYELSLESRPSTEDEELTETEVMEETQESSAVSVSVASSQAVSAEAGSGSPIPSDPSMEKAISEAVVAVGTQVAFSDPLRGVPGNSKLIGQVPSGTKGEPHAVVDSMSEALDRITQEILLMLAKSKVLVIWCFDQSISMKDDQQEIRDRIDRVYIELGMKDAAAGDALMTSVVSYGGGFAVHTQPPTYDVDKIRAAIDEIPTDTTGLEMMCQAVAQAISMHQGFATTGRRKLAMILVTDESGHPETNVQYLEAAIGQAKAARCTLYILGREAVFGYPFAHMRWIHPQTGHHHWLPIDRGPETAFVEQLQTEGFRRRYDSHNSGFGSYEQARMARESNGIFFMLPSLETNLVRGEKRRYELEAMRPYLPDLRMRQEVEADREKSILRATLWKIIYDLNPYREEVAKAMEVRFRFSANPETFVKQVREEQERAKQYILYLDAAAKALETIKPHRQTEYTPRWQANYDLIYAQVLAYTARTYEYGAYLEHFITHPKIVPLEKPNFIKLTAWDIIDSTGTVGGDVSKTYIERSADMLHAVIKDHPGTPWAARAQWELNRGFGVELREHYSYVGPRPPSPPRPSRPSPPTIPIPKL